MLTEPLAKVGINPARGGRDIAAGDVHGCFGLLSWALDGIGFDPEVDRLFLVGDLVDRGPQSSDALEWLARPWVKSVCGNHEFMAWRSALGRPYPHVDHAKHGGGWLAELDEGQRIETAKVFAALPMAMQVETAGGLVGIVHADCPFDDWAEMEKVDWSQDDEAIRMFDLCLWSTERWDRSYQGVVKGVKAVVHGHVVVPKHEALGNAHFIDTGGWLPRRSFTLLDLATMEPAKKRR